MTSQAKLRMALPPGWAAIDKQALMTALDEGFTTLGETERALMTRLRAAGTHVIAFSPSPTTGKPEAILTLTVVNDPTKAIGIEGDHSEEWTIRRWTGESTPGGASQISRATRSFAVGDSDEVGLISLYEIGFDSGAPGALVTILTKIRGKLADEAVDALDEIAATVYVEPLS